jgi:KDO2-lipid IV(A) lauroyltransferase
MISAYLIYFLFLFLGILPFPLFYGFSSVVGWLVRHIFRYRLKTTRSNLEALDIGRDSRKRLIGKSYRNMADITLEAARSFTISEAQVNLRHRIVNPEILQPYFDSGTSMICVTGHYGNWEWGAFSAKLQTPFHIVGFYKPLKNKRLDRIVRMNRGRFGTELASIKETFATFERNVGTPTIYLMAADQSPRNTENAIWVKFLGRETAFLHGPEKYSRLYNYPVFYAEILRVKRGHYDLHLSILADDPASLPEGEVTRRFAEKLESVIRKKPEDWLWSHNRWKLTR